MKRVTPRVPKVKMSGKNTVHLPLSDELNEKVDKMSLQAKRKKADFIRVVLEEEWTRQNAAAPAEVSA